VVSAARTLRGEALVSRDGLTKCVSAGGQRAGARTALGRSLLANNALQPLPDHAVPAGVGQHPWTDLPRRLVAHVLGVAALEVGYPVAFDVLMKSRDSPAHVLSG
jgi:hypothetical protein